jgi:transposase
VKQVFSLTLEFKLKPTVAQIAVFEDWLEQYPKVYNYTLKKRKDWYNSRKCQINSCSKSSEYIIPADGPLPSYSSQCKALTTYRKTSPALLRVNAALLQQTRLRLEKSFVTMWEQSHGFPRFKKQGTLRSFFIATSNGLLIKKTSFFAEAERKLKLRQKHVTRKKLVSNNRKRAAEKAALLHEYVANCRKDWHRKLSRQICDNAGMVFVEDLNLVGSKAAMLGKHCLDGGFGQLFNILEQTCFNRGVYFQKVEAKKTSEICPNCLKETGKKELSERVHSCHHCAYRTDRDVAAAQVVLKRALAAVGQTVKMLACK